MIAKCGNVTPSISKESPAGGPLVLAQNPPSRDILPRMSQDLHAQPNLQRTSSIIDSLPLTLPSTLTTFPSLKRRASSSFECPDDTTRKRMKEEPEDKTHLAEPRPPKSHMAFVEEFSQELQCGCCSELVYRPVLVIPCQHFFCGSCCMLWIRNGGTNCPACRGIATVAMPFRALQPLVDTLLRLAPHKARAEREREQADEVYKAGQTIRIPPPREVSPPPDVNRSTEYVHPCPHCLPNNPYDWRCPQPIADPVNDIEHAWHVDDGTPPGHAHCGNCENLLALRAPTTTRCDLCLVSFCGVGVQDRCIALPITAQQPHNLANLTDMIQSSDVYECFDGNTVEVDIMLEYLEAQGLSPRHIYREIVQWIQKLPRGFAMLIDLDIFSDIHAVAPGVEPNPDAPRNRACRMCAAEIFLWGLKEWWLRERMKGFPDEVVTQRKDCPNAGTCTRHRDDLAHAREFNHLFLTRVFSDDEDEPAEPIVRPSGVPSVPEMPTRPSTPPVIQPPPFAPSTNVPVASSSSSASISFLLNPDQDMGTLSPPDFRSPTPDTRNTTGTTEP